MKTIKRATTVPTVTDYSTINAMMNTILDSITASAIELAIITLKHDCNMTDAARVHMIYDTIKKGEQVALATSRQLDRAMMFISGTPLHDDSSRPAD